MRKLALVLALVFSGCTSTALNSAKEANRSTMEMKKCCGCAGMEQCAHNPDGTLCCKEDDCKCKQVTSR